MSNKKEYIYFVSFSHNNGFGNIELKTDKKFDYEGSALDIQKFMKEEYKVEVIVLNWFQLRGGKQ